MSALTPIDLRQNRKLGPFTAHVRTKPHPNRPGRVFTVTRKTWKAAENFLTDYIALDATEARWITNRYGIVYSRYAFGDHAPAPEAA